MSDGLPYGDSGVFLVGAILHKFIYLTHWSMKQNLLLLVALSLFQSISAQKEPPIILPFDYFGAQMVAVDLLPKSPPPFGNG